MLALLFQIIFNSLILWLITYLLGANPSSGITDGVTLGCIDCSFHSFEAIKTYLIGGIILGCLNAFLKPALKILTLPFYFFLMGFASLIINATVLYLLGFIINDVLTIAGVAYEINGFVNFIIAVAIFTFLNTIYASLISK